MARWSRSVRLAPKVILALAVWASAASAGCAARGGTTQSAAAWDEVSQKSSLAGLVTLPFFLVAEAVETAGEPSQACSPAR